MPRSSESAPSSQPSLPATFGLPGGKLADQVSLDRVVPQRRAPSVELQG